MGNRFPTTVIVELMTEMTSNKSTLSVMALHDTHIVITDGTHKRISGARFVGEDTFGPSSRGERHIVSMDLSVRYQANVISIAA